jgi:hypothetical protein
MIDAVSFLGLGRVFTANMTGNVVLLAFAVAGTLRNATVRRLAVPELTTTVLTLTLTGIASESSLAGGQGAHSRGDHAREQHRRAPRALSIRLIRHFLFHAAITGAVAHGSALASLANPPVFVKLVGCGLALLVVCGAAGPGTALGQITTPPGGTTPSGAIFDRLRNQSTRPVPQVSPPATPRSTMIWVPDRHVPVPGVSDNVLVPGHWEQRLSDHQVYTPPLIGRTPDGGVVNFPAGPRPPIAERQSP